MCVTNDLRGESFKPKRGIKQGGWSQGKIMLRSFHNRKRNWSQVCCWREVSAGLFQASANLSMQGTNAPVQVENMICKCRFFCMQQELMRCYYIAIWHTFKNRYANYEVGGYEMNAYLWLDKPLTRASLEAKFWFLSVRNIFLLNKTPVIILFLNLFLIEFLK